MKDYREHFPDRECREFWFVSDSHTVEKVQGFDCLPHNPDMWWCPEVGVSASTKHHLFNTEREAAEKALANALKAALKLSEKSSELAKRLKEL